MKSELEDINEGRFSKFRKKCERFYLENIMKLIKIRFHKKKARQHYLLKFLYSNL